jgi:hypothetical protein
MQCTSYVAAAAAMLATSVASAQTVVTPAPTPAPVIVTQPVTPVVVHPAPVVVAQPTPVTVVQPLPASAPYNPPPVGSVIQTSAGAHTITGSNGYDLTLQNDQKAGSGFTTLHALVQRQPDGTASYSRSEVEKLWPLQVGKRADVSMVTQQGGRALRWEVVRAENITVPAGTFATYVIEKRERTSDDQYEAVERMWYAPQLGYFAKYEQDLIRGIDHRAPWDLVSIRHPGTPVAVVPGYQAVGVPLRADTVENRAAFCRERGTTLLLSDGRRVMVDCDTYVRTETVGYQAWLAR